MGALRLDIPVIFVSGGPMKAGVTPDGKKIDLISVFEGVGQYKSCRLYTSPSPRDRQKSRKTAAACK